MIQARFAEILQTNALVTSGDKLLVAVSGGADSMALLHLLVELAPKADFSLMVAHLDHQLRPASQDDANFVATYCRQHNIQFVSREVDVNSLARESGVGLEEAGRNARRHFLQETAIENDCSAIALAHHADDQAETLLFRLMRGCGMSGLASMRIKNGLFIRPLLSFRKSELEDYLRRIGLEWREDATNSDIAITRNRIRHQLLPQMVEYNPKVVDALCRLSLQAADEDDYWIKLSDSFLADHGRETDDGFELDMVALNYLGRAERRRILRAFLQQVQGFLPSVDAVHIDQVDALLTAGRPQADLHLPGIWVARRYDQLICAVAAPDLSPYEISIEGPGHYELPTGDSLEFSFDESVEADALTEVFAAEAVTFPFTVRSPRPGDRFQPSGMRGRKLLKDYYIDEKIDRESRHRTPVVCCGEEVIWLAGRRRCDGFRSVPGGSKIKIKLIQQKQGVE